MIGATKVFFKNEVRKFIEYRVRDTKNLTRFSKKTPAEELGIFPLTYSFTSELFNKFVGLNICLKSP